MYWQKNPDLQIPPKSFACDLINHLKRFTYRQTESNPLRSNEIKKPVAGLRYGLTKNGDDNDKYKSLLLKLNEEPSFTGGFLDEDKPSSLTRSCEA